MSQGITPYDTGERLEPHPWVKVRGQVATPMRWCADAATPPEAEDFGRVDFNDEEGRTVLTLYVTHSPGGPHDPSGYVLHVENLIESLTITGGTEAAVLSLEHSPGLEELVSLAERGRADFLYQASHGDYSEQDQADAAHRWAAARAAADALRDRHH